MTDCVTFVEKMRNVISSQENNDSCQKWKNRHKTAPSECILKLSNTGWFGNFSREQFTIIFKKCYKLLLHKKKIDYYIT